MLPKTVWARTVLLLMVVMFASAGCTTPAGRTTGEVVDDATISTKVKTKLFESTELSGFAINVDTFERAVTLTGAVDTEHQKDLAGQIARSIPQVRKVNNLLTLKQ